jgi:ubiquinol-cytochrome c reductase cytochrome c subunit
MGSRGRWAIVVWVIVATLVLSLVLSLVAAPTAAPQGPDAADPPRQPTDDVEARLSGVGPDDVEMIYLSDCAGCHGVDGEGTDFSPPIAATGAATNYFWIASGRMPIRNVDEEIRRRPSRYDDETAVALAEHVAGFDVADAGVPLPDVDVGAGDLTGGARIYRESCAPCHLASGRGGALLGDWASSLQPSSALEVATAVRIGIGTMPVFGEAQISESDLNDLVAYTEYLREPDSPGGVELGYFGPRDETIIVFVFGLGVLVAFAVWINRRSRVT